MSQSDSSDKSGESVVLWGEPKQLRNGVWVRYGTSNGASAPSATQAQPSSTQATAHAIPPGSRGDADRLIDGLEKVAQEFATATGETPRTAIEAPWTPEGEAAFEKWWQNWRQQNGWPNTRGIRAGARQVYEGIVHGSIDTVTEQLVAQGFAAPSTRPEIESIPEGCTPTDAKVLREANGKFAEENHQLRRALRFYANGMHYHGLLHWEGPSGDDNWLCPPSDSDIPHFAEERREFVAKLDEAMVEDGSIAAATLRGKYLQFEGPEDEPKVVRGEPEWEIEQLAIRAEGGST